MTRADSSLCAVRETLRQISVNQDAYECIEHSWRRFTPWGFRRQYQLCKANEPLFARLGIEHPPFTFEVDPVRNPGEWVVRKVLGV